VLDDTNKHFCANEHLQFATASHSARSLAAEGDNLQRNLLAPPVRCKSLVPLKSNFLVPLRSNFLVPLRSNFLVPPVRCKSLVPLRSNFLVPAIAPERGNQFIPMTSKGHPTIVVPLHRILRSSTAALPITQPQRGRVKKNLRKTTEKDEKRNFGSREEGTPYVGTSLDDADRTVEVADIWDARTVCPVGWETFLDEALSPLWTLLRFDCVPGSGAEGDCFRSLLELDGGSIDTDCRNGKECCEEVLVEEHRRCRRAKREMRGR